MCSSLTTTNISFGLQLRMFSFMECTGIQTIAYMNIVVCLMVLYRSERSTKNANVFKDWEEPKPLYRKVCFSKHNKHLTTDL